MYLLRLQRMLDEANGRYRQNDKIRSYTASVRCQNDIENLSNIGMTSEDISYSLDVPITFVQKQKARIVKANEARSKFLRTGILSSPEFEGRPGVFTIWQK